MSSLVKSPSGLQGSMHATPLEALLRRFALLGGHICIALLSFFSPVSVDVFEWVLRSI